MKTVTSVSGGKTSSMMAIEFPTDHYIFAVVLTDHLPSAPKDKGLVREIQDRIPWFVASHEADLTLLNMLRLEQELGKRIDWVASEYSLDRYIAKDTDLPRYRSNNLTGKGTLDAIIVYKRMLPNHRVRFCTEETKLVPMFWHCYLNYFDGMPLIMNIGFRWDEPKRVGSWTCDKDRFKFPKSCSIHGGRRQKHSSIEWRVSQFPMFDAGISKLDVAKYWLEKGWQFPEISNCRFCFHHRDIEQQKQAQIEPANLQWWLEQEEKSGHTFGKRPLVDILAQPSQNIHNAPCHCTD